MDKEIKTTFFRTVVRKTLKLTALALPIVTVIFIIYSPNSFRLQPFWFRGMPLSYHTVSLRWNTPTKFILRFKLERRAHGENELRRIAQFSPLKRQFEDYGLLPDTIYQYRVKACRIFRCYESKIIELKTFNPAPDPPSNLKIALVSNYEIDLTWKDNSDDEDGFEVFREELGGFKSIAKLPANQTEFTDCPLLPGKPYTYSVIAFDEHYESEDNPTVSITMPELEKIGETHPLEKTFKIGALVWNGNGWTTAYSEATQDEPVKKEDDWKINTEIYFQRLDEDFKPIGDKTRISFDPCESAEPSLAWNGKEYGIAWSDSRVAKPWCHSGGDSSPPKEVFFARISADGKRIGSEVRLLSESDYHHGPRLFWQKDHYDLFYTGEKDLNYLRLDVNGKILSQPVPAGDSTWLWDITKSGDHYGITWISAGSMNRKILYFLDFDPESNADIKPIKLAKDSCEEPACLNLDYKIASPAVLWTGKNFGVCYKNCRTDTVLALINPKTRQYQTVIAMHMRYYQCTSGGVDASGECAAKFNWPDGYLQMQPAQCLWNGSEIAVLSTLVSGSFANAALARFGTEGKPIDQVRLLPISGDIAWLPLPKLYWRQDHYFTFYEDYLILIKP